MRKLGEGRHKAGCQCGFCKNMGSFGKKKKDDSDKEKSDDKAKLTAESVVAKLLEDDIPGGRAPDNHRWGHLDKEQLAIGTKVEMEHTRDPRMAEEIAADHLTEDPEYYQKLQKAGLADELDPAGPMPKAKASFYPSMGGPSSM